MTKKFLILGLAPMLALGACGGTTDTGVDNGVMATNDTMTDGSMMGGAMADNAMMGDNAMMADANASPDQRFANTVGASDYYEVEAGKLAQSKATSQGLKDFGAMMVEQHTASTEKLRAALATASPAIVPNPELNAEQEANLAALRNAEGVAFDTLYKTQQVAAHEKALATLKDYAANGDVRPLTAFATQTESVVQTHLDRISKM